MAKAVTYFAVLIIFVLFPFSESAKGCRVCDDFESYDHPKAKYCRNNPDCGSNITEIIRRWDFTAEEHYVYTEDGYQILVARAYSSISKKYPILIGHGGFLSPLAFVNRGEKSLVHYLGKLGFDVWIIGFRGSIYSRGHKKLTTDDNEYWSFSFPEMGDYDLRSALKLIKTKTKQKVLYIGYSEGCAASYVYSSSDPDDAKDKLKGIISLGPFAYVTDIKSYLKYAVRLLPILKSLIYAKTHGEVSIKPLFNRDICSHFPFQMYLCETLRMPLFGDDYDQMDPLYEPVGESMDADSIGINVLLHYNQIQMTNKFQLLDYGADMNYQKYGQGSPLPIELSKIPVPVTLFVGPNDWLATKSNAERLYSELSEESKGAFVLIDYKKWNHYDFVRAKDIVPLLFKPLLKEIAKMCD